VAALFPKPYRGQICKLNLRWDLYTPPKVPTGGKFCRTSEGFVWESPAPKNIRITSDWNLGKKTLLSLKLIYQLAPENQPLESRYYKLGNNDMSLWDWAYFQGSF